MVYNPIQREIITNRLWHNFIGSDLINDQIAEKYIDHLKYVLFSQSQGLSEKFFEDKFMGFSISILSRNQGLSEEFFTKRLRYLDLQWLCTNPGLSEKFLEQFFYHKMFGSLTANPVISERFLDRILSELFKLYQAHRDYQVEILERYLGHLYRGISQSPPRRLKTIMQGFIYPTLLNIISHPNFSETLVIRYLELFKNYLYPLVSGDRTICSNSNISQQFLEQHPDLIDWNTIHYNTSISEQFFRANLDKISCRNLTINSAISIQFLEEHLDDLDWSRITDNPNVTEDFLQRHIDLLPSVIKVTERVSEAFLRRNIEHFSQIVLCSESDISMEFYLAYRNVVKDVSKCPFTRELRNYYRDRHCQTARKLAADCYYHQLSDVFIHLQ